LHGIGRGKAYFSVCVNAIDMLMTNKTCILAWLVGVWKAQEEQLGRKGDQTSGSWLDYRIMLGRGAMHSRMALKTWLLLVIDLSLIVDMDSLVPCHCL